MDAVFGAERTLAELAALGWSDLDSGNGTVEGLDYSVRVGDWWLLVPPGLPAEVVPIPRCSRLPYTARWCLGLANHRGSLVPVYDLGALIESGGRLSASGYVLILGQRESRAGLRIDAIQSIRLPSEMGFGPLFPMPNLPEIELDGVRLEGTIHARLDFLSLLEILARRAVLIEADAASS